MSKKEEKLLDHDYDGIQELDNLLPRWWLFLFYATILFAIAYPIYYYYHDYDPYDWLGREMAAVKKLQDGDKPADTGPDETQLAALLTDQTKLEAGNKLFGEKCASCHGPKGEGLIGPNLTDFFWIHGDGGLPSIFKVVADGVPDKGMPPWKGMMKPDELNSVVAFLKTLEGKNVAGKSPQGTEYKKN